MRYILAILLATGIWSASVAQEYVCTERESGDEARISDDNRTKPDELQYDEYDYNINDDQLDENDRVYDYSSVPNTEDPEGYQFESSGSEDVDMSDEMMIEDTSSSCANPTWGSSQLNDNSSMDESGMVMDNDTSLFMEEDLSDNGDIITDEEALVVTSDSMTEGTKTVTYKDKKKEHQSKFRNIVEAPFKVAATIVSETGEGLAHIAYSPVKGVTKLFRGEPKDQYNKKYKESEVDNPPQPVQKTEYYYEQTQVPTDEGYNESSQYNFDNGENSNNNNSGDMNAESPYQDEDIQINTY